MLLEKSYLSVYALVEFQVDLKKVTKVQNMKIAPII